MKNKLTHLALALGLAILASTSARAAEKKPNILVIFGDDIGQANVSAYPMGLMGYRTPYRNYRWRIEASRTTPNRCCMQVAEVWLTTSAPTNRADR